MNVSNQKPAVLSPIHTVSSVGVFNPIENLKTAVVKPLFSPIVGTTATLTDDNGNDLDENTITDILLETLDDNVNPVAEDAMSELFYKTLVYFEKTPYLSIADLFANQAASTENAKFAGKRQPLPFPNANIIYSPSTDVIPACREFIAGKCSYEKLFASFAFWKKPTILGFYFANDKAYEEFIEWLNTQVAAVASTLPADTISLFNEFGKTQLTGLTESYILRNDEDDNNHDYSFARMIMYYLMTYTSVINNQSLFGIMPFNLSEVFCPKNILFINLEAHSKATASALSKEWDIIERSLTFRINMVSNKKLNKLTAVQRNLQKMASSAANATRQQNMQLAKARMMRFSKTKPTTTDLFKIVGRILRKMTFVNKSENVYKQTKSSYQKPNRRDPDDFNKPGKIVSQRYKPDIHVYIDTSGSISERNYEDAMKSCIRLAKKLNVNLYFNSFSHVLSQCTHLHTKGKTLDAIYKTMQKVPKVTGGTDYEQIWHYINKSKTRRRELSLILTDFEWTPRNHFVEHPKNLYYIPCSNMDWKQIVYYATNFGKTMLRNEPNIRKHILF